MRSDPDKKHPRTPEHRIDYFHERTCEHSLEPKPLQPPDPPITPNTIWTRCGVLFHAYAGMREGVMWGLKWDFSYCTNPAPLSKTNPRASLLWMQSCRVYSLFFFFFFSFKVWLGSFHPSLILLNRSFPNMSQRRTRREGERNKRQTNGNKLKSRGRVPVQRLSREFHTNFWDAAKNTRHHRFLSAGLNQGHQIFEN